jgi:hypothetical protein
MENTYTVMKKSAIFNIIGDHWDNELEDFLNSLSMGLKLKEFHEELKAHALHDLLVIKSTKPKYYKGVIRLWKIYKGEDVEDEED